RREDLLVRRLQLLVRRLLRLDDGLEVLLRRGELLVEARDRLVALPRRRLTRRLLRVATRMPAALRLLEEEEEVARSRRVLDRDDLDVHVAEVAVGPDADPVPAHARPRLPRLLHRGAELHHQPLARELQEVQRRRAGGRLEVRARLAAEL